MPTGIDELILDKEEGDPWVPDDANAVPRISEQVQETWEVAHSPDGWHRLPVPIASAIIKWDGSAYSIVQSVGVISITRLSAGRVRVKLSFTLPTSTEWIGTAEPTSAELAGAECAATTFDTCDMQIYRYNSGGAPTAYDASFIFEAYGERQT